MDVGERWRVMTTDSSQTGGSPEKTIINNIMLKFRPIAPKPPAGGFLREAESSSLLNRARTKRKYVRVKKRASKKVTSPPPSADQRKGDVTLQLLPENHNPVIRRSTHLEELEGSGPASDRTVAEERREEVTDDRKAEKVETWVTVESVTDACTDMALGCTDGERIQSMESDACPSFVSDGLNRVQWVNQAYRRMAAAAAVGGRPASSSGSSAAEVVVVVWLEIKEGLLAYVGQRPARFSCWARMQCNTWRKEEVAMVVPCDVWRMDVGGFAWRLDLKAALSLSLLTHLP